MRIWKGQGEGVRHLILGANDVVRELSDVPLPSVGAPNPMVLSTEHSLALLYYQEQTNSDFDGKSESMKSVGPDTDDEKCVVIRFDRVLIHTFGTPNMDIFYEDEFLREKGLQPHLIYEVNPSRWLQENIELNRVHPYHKDNLFEKYRHLVIPFHDTTFQILAESFKCDVVEGSTRQVGMDVLTELR